MASASVQHCLIEEAGVTRENVRNVVECPNYLAIWLIHTTSLTHANPNYFILNTCTFSLRGVSILVHLWVGEGVEGRINNAAIYTQICIYHRRPCSHVKQTKGAFHLSELTGQAISVAVIISLLIITVRQDHSNTKYARRRWSFSKNSWNKPILFSNWLEEQWSGRPVLSNGKRPKKR